MINVITLSLFCYYGDHRYCHGSKTDQLARATNANPAGIVALTLCLCTCHSLGVCPVHHSKLRQLTVAICSENGYCRECKRHYSTTRR